MSTRIPNDDAPPWLLAACSQLEALIDGEIPPPISPSASCTMEEKALCELLNRVTVGLGESRRFFAALARGELDGDESYPARDNMFAAPLKELHARLRELTWQAQQVAKGDYRQRINFLGDFSEAFNSMVYTLERREHSLRQAVGELDRRNGQLRESQDRLQKLFDSVADAVLVMDQRTRIVNCNESVRSVLGYEKQEIIGQDGRTLFIDPVILDELLAGKMVSPDQQHVTAEAVVKRKNGETFFSLVTASLLEGDQDGTGGRLAVVRDITKIKEAELLLKEQAIRDPLTGLFNRREALDLLDRAFHLARRHRQPIAVAMCDLDEFKKVNDTHGHLAGDRALRQFASILKDGLRKEDIVGRFGGDEFVVIFPQATRAEALPALERALARVQTEAVQSPLEGTTFVISASFGLAELRAEHCAANDVLAAADEALYEAKKAGGKSRRMDKGRLA